MHPLSQTDPLMLKVQVHGYVTFLFRVKQLDVVSRIQLVERKITKIWVI